MCQSPPWFQCACKHTDHFLVFRDVQLLRLCKATSTICLQDLNEHWSEEIAALNILKRFSTKSSSGNLYHVVCLVKELARIFARRGLTPLKRILLAKYLMHFSIMYKIGWTRNVEGIAVLIKERCYCCMRTCLQYYYKRINWLFGGRFEKFQTHCSITCCFHFFLHKVLHLLFSVHSNALPCLPLSFCWSQYMVPKSGCPRKCAVESFALFTNIHTL